MGSFGLVVFLRILRPRRSRRTDTPLPDPTRFRAGRDEALPIKLVAPKCAPAKAGVTRRTGPAVSSRAHTLHSASGTPRAAPAPRPGCATGRPAPPAASPPATADRKSVV